MLAMSLIDLLIIIVTLYAFTTLYNRRHILKQFHAMWPISLMLLGLGVTCIFYLIDLGVMLILPRFIPMMQAMKVMEELHLNYHWYVTMTAVPLLVIGIIKLIKVVIPAYSSVVDSLKNEQDSLKNLTIELVRHKEDLEEMVNDRTAETRQALKTAETSNKAKSEFLSCMSHELRTPLHAIIGFSQLLDAKSDDQFTATDKDQIKEILHGGRHLLELINGILDLSSIEAGHLDVSINNISLNEILSDCISMIQPLADKNDIRLNYYVDLNLDYIVCIDKKCFKQAMLNLLSNAIKYNCKEGEVTLKSMNLSNGYVRVLVKDTGIGIDHEFKTYLFKEYVRAATTKKSVSGTGLGLVITKSLIEAMGGKIGFESNPGEGSNFWVDIPLAEVAG